MKIKNVKENTKGIARVKNKGLASILKHRLFITVTAAVAGLAASQPVQAFMGYHFDYTSNWIQQDLMRRTFENYNETTKEYNDYVNSKSGKTSKGSSSSSKKTGTAGNKTSTTSTAKKPAKKANITFKSSTSTKGLDALVAKYPAKDRENVRKSLKQLQDSFPQVARSVGIPTNDLSSGLSALIAGAYMAYNNVSLNDNYMKPLANQLRSILQTAEEFDRLSDSQKKDVYDQMVIIGMLLAVSQSENQKKPNSRTTAQLKTAGKQVLEGLLKVNASKVRITSSGLSY